MRITEIEGDLFDAPDGAVLIRMIDLLPVEIKVLATDDH